LRKEEGGEKERLAAKGKGSTKTPGKAKDGNSEPRIDRQREGRWESFAEDRFGSRREGSIKKIHSIRSDGGKKSFREQVAFTGVQEGNGGKLFCEARKSKKRGV